MQQNCVFHSYVFLVGKLEGVKIPSNLQSHAMNKESLQGLHDMRCHSEALDRLMIKPVPVMTGPGPRPIRAPPSHPLLDVW